MDDDALATIRLTRMVIHGLPSLPATSPFAIDTKADAVFRLHTRSLVGAIGTRHIRRAFSNVEIATIALVTLALRPPISR